MEFTSKFNELKSLFCLHQNVIDIPGSDIEIRNYDFSSGTSLAFPFEDHYDPYSYNQQLINRDENIRENVSFRYPVFVPKSNTKFNHAIFLMHGLNEKKWNKYLPWAYYLAENTQRPVILFPMSFHMNRSPESWANPKAMMPLLYQRQGLKNLAMSTFANVALSERLSEDPLRFFRSGRQSAEDIVDLMHALKMGKHPLIEADAQVDFFAYSIGAFLAQILFIANPQGLFSNSKLFLFCGGTHFNHMYGTSRLIMDNQAYFSLRKYYLGEFIDELKLNTPFSNFITGNPLGNAFRAMLAPKILRSYRENIFQKLSNHIKIIALKKDKVTPANYIEYTFSCIRNRMKNMIEVIDFPYEYSHEVPFPINANPNYLIVDQSFERVFRSAVDFLK